MGSDHPTGRWTLAELMEMRHPFNHVEHALDITYTKITDGDRLLDLWNAADIRTARSISTEKMKSRLLRYPLSGPIDDAVVVVLGRFGDELCSAIGHPAAQVVLGTLPFVEPWNISLQGDSDSESPPLPAHSDIPHADHLESTPLCLPVLLSAYQTAGVSLDNATRNRLRLASVGAVRFLAVLGVTDFPVYGLSICGPYGIPSVTWYSSEDKVRIIHAATDVPTLTFSSPYRHAIPSTGTRRAEDSTSRRSTASCATSPSWQGCESMPKSFTDGSRKPSSASSSACKRQKVWRPCDGPRDHRWTIASCGSKEISRMIGAGERRGRSDQGQTRLLR